MKVFSKIEFVLASKYRLLILRELSKSPRTSEELSRLIGVYEDHVTLTLTKLERKELIKSPDPKQRNDRVYTISEEGKSVLGDIVNDAGEFTNQ